MNIIKRAFKMLETVQHFFSKVKRFYYQVVLLGHRCVRCNGKLSMTAESRCGCQKCGLEFDPTVTFQKCLACGGAAMLRVRRYYCQDCGREVNSRFLFETLPFEREYFKQKMAQSRRRQKEKLRQVKEMLAQSRSQALALDAVDLDSIPGLLVALNGLAQGINQQTLIELKGRFDLSRYESHIKAHIQDYFVNLRGIPAMIENRRKDLIWRFIAVIFLAHGGVVDIFQEGNTIMVKKHETNTEGCAIPGSLKPVDRLEGFAC